MSDAIIREVEDIVLSNRKLPKFKQGWTIKIFFKIREGDKEKVQSFEGIVLQVKGKGKNKTVTLMKIIEGVRVERIFPLYSPNIEKIQVIKMAKARKKRLFYLREKTGKEAKLKEIFVSKEKLQKGEL